MSGEKLLIKPLNRIILHILFWLFSFFTINYVFAFTDEINTVDYLFTGLFHLSLLIGVYFNLGFLIPKFFQKKRYFIYCSLLVLVAIFTGFLNIMTFNWLADIILPGYYFVSHFEALEVLIIISVYLTFTSLLKLSKSWFHLQELNQQINNIEKKHLENQLNALKAQINPHFLFNSLNVLHSLAHKQSNESSSAIIKLAYILRYVIYETNNKTVKLSEEVKLIENYLSLQYYRIDNVSKIEFSTDIQVDQEIAPMLILPLVENSFKHGIKGDVNGTFVKMKLFATDRETYFEIDNNKGEPDMIVPENQGGIGISNIEQRLQLIYPDRHSFSIEDSKDNFKVIMIIRHGN